MTVTPWGDPTSAEEATVLGLTAKQMRVLNMIVQVRGNPMIKVCPTKKTYFLIENSPTKVHIIVRNNNKDVPYCDCF